MTRKTSIKYLGCLHLQDSKTSHWKKGDIEECDTWDIGADNIINEPSDRDDSLMLFTASLTSKLQPPLVLAGWFVENALEDDIQFVNGNTGMPRSGTYRFIKKFTCDENGIDQLRAELVDIGLSHDMDCDDVLECIAWD